MRQSNTQVVKSRCFVFNSLSTMSTHVLEGEASNWRILAPSNPSLESSLWNEPCLPDWVRWPDLRAPPRTMVASVSSAAGSALRLKALGHAHTQRGVLLLLTAMVTAITADSTVAGKKIPFTDYRRGKFVLIVRANGLYAVSTTRHEQTFWLVGHSMVLNCQRLELEQKQMDGECLCSTILGETKKKNTSWRVDVL